jgi:PPOX class probable F420-dependent enzyme
LFLRSNSNREIPRGKILFGRKLRQYLKKARVARLATVNKDGTIHLVPIVFASDSSCIYFANDRKPKKTTRLRRLANISRYPNVTVLFDSYSEDWKELSFVMVYARARLLIRNSTRKKKAVKLLKAKYSQYRIGGYLPRNSKEIVVVRLEPRRIVQWSAKSASKPSLK